MSRSGRRKRWIEQIVKTLRHCQPNEWWKSVTMIAISTATAQARFKNSAGTRQICLMSGRRGRLWEIQSRLRHRDNQISVVMRPERLDRPACAEFAARILPKHRVPFVLRHAKCRSRYYSLQKPVVRVDDRGHPVHDKLDDIIHVPAPNSIDNRTLYPYPPASLIQPSTHPTMSPRRKPRGRPLNGWLIIDKPAGLTSTDVVNRVKRIFDAQKAGHGGTLDPLATGLLPVAFGTATKTVPYVMDGTKLYRFTLKFGEARDTDDADGAITETSDIRPDDQTIEAALPQFRGDIMQVPPVFSAIKVAGERAYDMARDGRAPIWNLAPPGSTASC